MRKPRPETRMVPLNARVPAEQLLAVAAQAAREMRTLSAMTRILLAEALAARRESKPSEAIQPEPRSSGKEAHHAP